MKLKFLPEKHIEAATLCLLAAYSERFGVVKCPPIPVEAILESHLDLRLSLDDLTKMLEVPDVLGATWIFDRRVVIDQHLDPTEHPKKEGRYRFTVAHEVGHWELHRHAYLGEARQGGLFGQAAKPSIVCRAQSKKDPMEWQADTFAGYLLMPKEMVFEAWREVHGTLDPYVGVDEISDLSARWGLAEDETPTVSVARDLAPRFQVSGQAMQIRLVKLGLILTKTPEPGLFTQ